MKSPSKNIAASIKGQSPGGRGPERVETSRPGRYAPSMTVPGEVRTTVPQGNGTARDGRQDRSAVKHAAAAGKMVGGG